MIITQSYKDGYQIIDGQTYLIYNTDIITTVHIRGISSYTKHNSDMTYTKNKSNISYT